MSSVASAGPQLPDKAVFPQASIPQDFMDQLYKCTSMFKDLQVSACVVSNLHILLFIKFDFTVIPSCMGSWFMTFSLCEMHKLICFIPFMNLFLSHP
jgi:hypothetical protein